MDKKIILEIEKKIKHKELEVQSNIKKMQKFIADLDYYNSEFAVFNKNEFYFFKECKTHFKICKKLTIEINILKQMLQDVKKIVALKKD